MSSRPWDWAPLCGMDPLPGDAEAMAEEAARLRRTGQEARAQIARLRVIAEDSASVGEHAAALRLHAGELARRLEKTVGRYERTSDALREWSDEAARLQSETLQARHEALDADAVRARDEQAAQQLLQDARTKLAGILDRAETGDRKCSALIEEATDDGVEDGGWANFKDWVDRNAGWIKAASTVLGYVALGVALIAIVIPGLNVLAVGLMLAVLAGHSTLASTGNGSWVDVGIDIVALTTFGVGMGLAHGMRATQQSARTAAAIAARRAAERAALAESHAARVAAGRLAGGSGARAHAARDLIHAAKAQAREAGQRAARELRDMPLANPTRAERWAARDIGTARNFKDVEALAARFPGSRGLTEAAEEAIRALEVGRTTWNAGFRIDVGDKVFDLTSDRYSEAKNRFVREVGSTW